MDGHGLPGACQSASDLYGGRPYVHVYRSYGWRGVTYYRYVPPIYYGPAFYGWAWSPWRVPIGFRSIRRTALCSRLSELRVARCDLLPLRAADLLRPGILWMGMVSLARANRLPIYTADGPMFTFIGVTGGAV